MYLAYRLRFSFGDAQHCIDAAETCSVRVLFDARSSEFEFCSIPVRVLFERASVVGRRSEEEDTIPKPAA